MRTLWTIFSLCSIAASSGSAFAIASPEDTNTTDSAENGGAPTDASSVTIKAPRALTLLGADYPVNAEGEHDVVLELLIGAAGSVLEAKVLSGDEPFRSASLAATPEWIFIPALRDNTPVAARIRVAIHFTPPEPEPTTSPIATPEPAAEGMVATDPPVEIIVMGDHPADVKKLGRADVRQIPGAFGDPFRAIEVLPGVTPIVSGLPYFFIRGAPPGNVGYFFDQVNIPLLFHGAAGPGVIHPAFIESVDLYAGAYPAKYGRYAGGIIEGEPAQPRHEVRGEALIRLLDAGAFLEVPFADGKGNAMFGGRYSYTGLILSALAPEVDLGYWDYQTRITYALTPKDTLQLFAFGSHDYVAAETSRGEEVELLNLTFHRLNASYERALSPYTTLDVDVIGSLNRTGGGDDDDIEEGDATDGSDQGVAVTGRSIGARVALQTHVSPSLTVRFGTDAYLSRAAIELNFEDKPRQPQGLSPDDQPTRDNEPESAPVVPIPVQQPGEAPSGASPSIPLPPAGLPPNILLPIEDVGDARDQQAALERLNSRVDVLNGVWVEAVWRPVKHITLTPSVRLDSYRTGEQWELGFDPRITARYQLSDTWSMIHTLGVAHQAPSFVIPIPGLDPNLTGGLQRAFQSSAGAEVKLPESVFASLTAFQNVTLNSSDFLSTARFQATGDNDGSLADRTRSHAYGFELFMRRSFSEKLGGLLSYTWSRSTRSLANVSGMSSFDRTHIVNLALAYDLGRNWRLAGRFMAYSGVPASVAYAAAFKDPPRTPWYHRIDWRLEKRWALGKSSWLALIAEVTNTTLNKETLDTSCYAFGCKETSFGPVTLPSLGIEASF
jgi:hypothetical protein